MHTLLYILLGVVVFFLLIMVWGISRLRKGNSQAVEAIRKMRLEDVERLAVEGHERILKGYGVSIDLKDREKAAWALDDLFRDDMKLKGAFEKPGFYRYFVLPVGALIGEFIRLHANGVWKQGSEGLFMDVPVKDGVATCYPFDKALKQINRGEKGDLYAFLMSSTQLSSVSPVDK